MDEIRITVDDIHSTLNTTNRKALAVVKQVCRARPAGYKYSGKYKSGVWDGYLSLQPTTTTFPTGLLGLVVEALRAAEYRVTIKRTKPSLVVAVDPECLHDVVLRDYQCEAVSKLLRASRGIAKMATNAGKTEVIAALAHYIEGECVVLVSRKELLHQTANRLSLRLQEPVGIIGDGVWKHHRITVAMVQTLSRSKKRVRTQFKNNKAVFIDECHHGSSAQYMDVLPATPGTHRYGFSGTPMQYQEYSDLSLIAATGRIVYEVTNADLIDAGYSAKPLVKLVTVTSDDAHEWKASFQEAYVTSIVDNEDRNRKIAELAASRTENDIILIIVRYVRHGELLHDLIPGSEFVSGSHSSDHRRDVLERMRSEPGVYIATNIFDEGVDVPSINILIMAAGGKAERTVLQRVGRGLRQKADGRELIVYDFIDDTNKYLLNHSEARMDVYIDEGFATETDTTKPDAL